VSELGKITRLSRALTSGGPHQAELGEQAAAAWQSASMSRRCERTTPTPRAAAASTMAASEGVTPAAGSRESPPRTSPRAPGSAPRPRGRGSTRSPSRACGSPIAQTVLAPDPGPGDKSDRLRGVGQALLASREREGREPPGRRRAHSARPKADKVKPAGQSHGEPGTPWPGHARVYIPRRWPNKVNRNS
jgi:hypothetical protein